MRYSSFVVGINWNWIGWKFEWFSLRWLLSSPNRDGVKHRIICFRISFPKKCTLFDVVDQILSSLSSVARDKTQTKTFSYKHYCFTRNILLIILLLTTIGHFLDFSLAVSVNIYDSKKSCIQLTLNNSLWYWHKRRVMLQATFLLLFSSEVPFTGWD